MWTTEVLTHSPSFLKVVLFLLLPLFLFIGERKMRKIIFDSQNLKIYDLL